MIAQVEGRPERPRLAVYRSNNHIYAQVPLPVFLLIRSTGHGTGVPGLSNESMDALLCQVIDDSAGSTLVAASTLTPEIREKLNGGGGGNTVRMS